MTSGTFRRTCGIRIQARNLVTNGVAQSPINVTDGPQESYVYGTGEDGGSIFVATQRYLAAGATATYDLYSGTDFVDVFGDAADIRLIKVISVWIEDGGDTAGVRIGGAGSNPWAANFADTSDMVVIYPDGPDWSAGRPSGIEVTSTSRNLKLENLGVTAATVYFAISATSAVPGAMMGIGFLGYSLLTYS